MVNSTLLFGDISKCDSPVLSIMIPTFGRAEYLEQAIASAVDQEWKALSYEIVVVSNDPNDSMERIINRFKTVTNLFIYRNHENIGMVGNSNRCAELARGRYFAFLHDDDYLLPGYLKEVSTQIISDHEKKCFITGRYVLFENNCAAYRNALIKQFLQGLLVIPRLFRGKHKELRVEDNLYSATNCYLSPSCGTVIERQTFIDNGGFDKNILFSWDWDFFLRLNLKERIYAGYNPVAVYRIGNNASLKSGVKYEFYDYFRSNFLKMMINNHIGEKYIYSNHDEIIASVFVRWDKDLSAELNKRGETIPHISRFRLFVFQIRSHLYFYNNNLAFQKVLASKHRKEHIS